MRKPWFCGGEQFGGRALAWREASVPEPRHFGAGRCSPENGFGTRLGSGIWCRRMPAVESRLQFASELCPAFPDNHEPVADPRLDPEAVATLAAFRNPFPF